MIIFDIETTGLNPMRDKVLTVQLKHGDKIAIWKLWEENDETKVIENFFNYIKKSDEKIVGYNISRFDINFLLTRLLINNKLTDEIQKIVREKEWVELTEFQKNNHGLDNWTKELSISRKSPVTGRHTLTLYELKQYDKIVDHAIDDLLVCEEIIKKLKLKI